MENFKNKYIIRRGYNFIQRTSKGVVWHQSILKELEDIALTQPDVTRTVLDKALRDKSLTNVKVDFESEDFRREINKRAFVKNLKQKLSFALGSIPMFKTLQDISVAKALNPAVQVPLSMDLYFGISIPAFVALHIAEHTLPPGTAKKAVQGTKVLIGLPFCVMAECVDRVTSKGLKMVNLPDAPLNMQGTMGVPSDLKLQDVLNDMKNWGEENSDQITKLADTFSKRKRL